MTQEIPIASIKIGERFRKDMGDIDELIESIERCTLLHAIVVDSDSRLIDGQRRILAYQKMNRDCIRAQVVDVPSLIAAERDANEVAKRFTVSERVAIGEAMEKELQGRQANRAGQKSHSQDTGRTHDLVGRRTGFGCGKTYERAKKAVREAQPEVVKAMDDRRLAPTAGYKLSRLPRAEQLAALEEKMRPQDREATRKRIAQKCERTPKAKEILQANSVGARVIECCSRLQRYLTIMSKMKERPTPVVERLAFVRSAIDTFMQIGE